VGVFGDTSVDDVVAVVNEVGLAGVQLHGETPGVAAVREALTEGERKVLLIKVIAVPAAAADLDAIKGAVAGSREHVDLILFDTRSQGKSGGTGQTFAWEVARDAAEGTPYLVAGGIGPHNVREVLDRSGAWGVDVSSGVEGSPGAKDPDLLRALFAPLAALC
jgi:phosphoribosylanthranilate isomerase